MKVCAAIIVRDGKHLITKRSMVMKLPLKWEFPGGKLEEGETPEACIVREIKEELGIEIKDVRYFCSSHFRYEFGDVELIAYLATMKDEKAVIDLLEHETYEWVEKEEIEKYDFAPADIPIVKKLVEFELI